ncbi:MAG: DUF4293 domain-containing protein [Bacteroidales bacterium]|nr:DUF4293 domain-containing protein [Bacteroidales bacterium]
MIQRVQTVYMLASVIAILTMHFFWLASFAIPEATFELNSLGLVCQTKGFETDRMVWELFIVLLLMVALPLINIFLYKNRKLQLRVLIYTIILNVLYYGLFFWECYRLKGDVAALSQGGVVDVHYNIMMLVMPAVSIFALIMAARGVIFDIALIKSLERLR